MYTTAYNSIGSDKQTRPDREFCMMKPKPHNACHTKRSTTDVMSLGRIEAGDDVEHLYSFGSILIYEQNKNFISLIVLYYATSKKAWMDIRQIGRWLAGRWMTN